MMQTQRLLLLLLTGVSKELRKLADYNSSISARDIALLMVNL